MGEDSVEKEVFCRIKFMPFLKKRKGINNLTFVFKPLQKMNLRMKGSDSKTDIIRKISSRKQKVRKIILQLAML